MTTARHIPLLAALALAACAPGMKPGALSPVGARVTNEVLDADQHTLEAWARRVAALGASTTAATPERAYMAARAAAWLGFARDAYAADPRDSTADRALAQTRYLVRALETKTPLPAEGTASIPAGPAAGLWGVVDSLRNDGAAIVAPTVLAEAEGALVRAAYLAATAPATGTLLVRNAANAARDCDVQLQLTRAEQLLTNLRGSSARIAAAPALVPLPVPAASAFTVELAGSPMAPHTRIAVKAPAVHPAIEMAADTLPPMQLVVHFAPRSSALTAGSRAALDEVITGLRAHRAARISFEGYTGRRAGERFDRALARRRTATVQRYLADAKLDLARLTVAGRSSAPDARMMLSFIGADGRTLTLEGVHAPEPKDDAPPEPHGATFPTLTKPVVPERSPTIPR
jgi:outer membrane protein OmpA-like peptidoglycan-associated protein